MDGNKTGFRCATRRGIEFLPDVVCETNPIEANAARRRSRFSVAPAWKPEPIVLQTVIAGDETNPMPRRLNRRNGSGVKLMVRARV